MASLLLNIWQQEGNLASSPCVHTHTFNWENSENSLFILFLILEEVHILVSRMLLEEIHMQMSTNNYEANHLSQEGYNFWSYCKHVQRCFASISEEKKRTLLFKHT